ncbi:MAG: DUF389 domain-containing protein [Nevskiaceae bacterium]
MDETGGAGGASLAAQVKRVFQSHFGLEDDQADHDVVDERIRSGIHLRGTNLWVLMFAILVASIGLNVNSTAVIIGAMLISPLMGPIMGVGYAAAVYDFDLIKLSLRSWGLAILISLVTSTLYFAVSPLREAGHELLARTAPTIWDVLIALFGGLAGIIALTREERNNVVPGVAIATALMPPLCTAGYAIANGQLYFFFGAMYLFVINSVFIAVSTIVIAKLINLPRRQWVDKALEARFRHAVVAVSVATILPSIWLAWGLVQSAVFKADASAFVRAEFVLSDVHVAGVQLDASKREIEVSLIGEPISDADVAELERRLANYRLGGARLVVHQAGDASAEVSSLRASLTKDLGLLRTSLAQDLYQRSQAEVLDKEQKIRNLEKSLEVATALRQSQQAIARELLAQYPQLKTAAVSTVTEWGPAAEAVGDVLVVRVTSKQRLTDADRRRISQWLKVRTQVERVRVFEDG